MGCLPCTTLQPEVTLLNDCYPPPKQLLASAPDYRPLSQDLSKLTYYATNKPSKIAKIGEELEKRVTKEAYKSSGGYPKYRASLLISLAILRALISECKRDLNLLSRSIIRIVNVALGVTVYQKGDIDLEVVGRASSCFTAFTTYSDGAAVGVDDSLTSAYLAVLKKFAAMAMYNGVSEKPDMENRNRTRLIALASLNGAASSDGLFAASDSDFAQQISIIIPPLLSNIFEGSMAQLKLETAKIEMDASPSPYFSEFSVRRPITDRRAPSLHAHIPGEKGPSSADVLSAALRSLHSLIAQCQIQQASHVLDSVFLFLNKQGWTDVEQCCWLAERLTAFMMLQYRFVVPTRLVEMLVDLSDDVPPSPRHTSALSMVTTILNSSISLVGLAVSDLLNNLVTLIVRRVRLDEKDALLPPLVQCIASLGTHVYYADQINDIVEELAMRIADIPSTDKSRSETVRVLILCITGVMTSADEADEAEAKISSPTTTISADKGKAPQIGTPAIEIPRQEWGRRNPITPEVWQETLPLICESTYTVRVAYFRALLLFLENEMPRDRKLVRPTDLTTFRFCNALYAALYTLAMSSCLGADIADSNNISGQPSPKLPSSTSANKNSDSTHEKRASGTQDKGVTFDLTEPTPSDTPSNANGVATPPKKGSRTSRRVSLPLNRLNSFIPLTSFDNVATPYDFAAIVKIIDELHSAIPVAALITGIPMLLALDRDAGMELIRRPGDGRSGAWVLERKRAIRETVGIVFKMLGEKWGVEKVVEIAQKSLQGLSEPFVVPSMEPPPPPSVLPLAERPAAFYQHTIEGEPSSASLPLIDPEIVVRGFSSSTEVLRATGKDEHVLSQRFSSRWTVEKALKDSVERFSSAQIHPDNDPHYDVANVLMNIDNSSYQSFARPASKAIDVTDLREALGGRINDPTSSSPPSIVSTAGAQTLPGDTVTRKPRPNPDVKEVLREIFKDKKRGSNTAGQGVNGSLGRSGSKLLSKDGGKLGRRGSKKEETEVISDLGVGNGNGNGNGPLPAFDLGPKITA